ncbi:chymase-like isoform X2 [Tachysurus vachellii]|uniref:chymase-like isoform X2 n=1 Tax=Tachysurus vachellii TaxID=175792 RepID=UPI00296AC016|nr:chymase-like isoform X2 [Tachysurus vachellii]
MEVKAHSRPYMVSVQINNMHVCSGMLIKTNYVLTTAHCVDDIEYSGKNKLEVVLGAHNISQKEPQQQRIKVKKYIKHPCYKSNERPNDIMLLKLKSKAKLKNSSIAGWGRTKQNSAASRVLREGDSGSPLICGNEPQGLAAYTYPHNCLDLQYPEVYTKLSYFLPWIKEIIH